MPQASDELRLKMASYFGDPIDDSGPEKFLLSKGWTENRFCWSKPSDREPTEQEWDCMQFLIDEWDHEYKRPE